MVKEHEPCKYGSSKVDYYNLEQRGQFHSGTWQVKCFCGKWVKPRPSRDPIIPKHKKP